MAIQIRYVLTYSALLGAYMALWIHSEAHIASMLGISKNSGILAGFLVSLTVWIRLQGSIRISRLFSTVRSRKLLILLSPFISFTLYSTTIISTNNIIKILSFILFTLYLGMILAVISTKIYKETEHIYWNSIIFMFKSLTILSQIVTLLFLKIVITEYSNLNIIVLFIPLILLSLLAASYIHKIIIPSTSYRTLDLFLTALVNPYSIKIITDKDINRISSFLAGIFVLKILILPLAVGNDPFMILLLYAIPYFIGTKLASYYYHNTRIINIIAILSFLIIINLPPTYSLILIGLTIGFLEVSIILLILNYRPRDIIKSNFVPSMWIIFGSLVVGVFSEFIPDYTPYAVFIIIIVGYLFRNNYYNKY